MTRQLNHLRPVILIVLLSFAVFAPAYAADGGGLSFSLDCTGFSSSAGEIRLDRDNTGNNREAFVVTAIDGAGNPILDPVLDSFFVGGTVSWQDGEFFAWTVLPHFNPLTLKVVSIGGNNLPEQIVYTTTGTCVGLPTVSEAFIAAGNQFYSQFVNFILPADGSTAPAVPINTAPPRPVNPEGLAESQSGYAVVATDNLFMRSGDGPEYAPVAIVDGGEYLVVLGRNDETLPDDSDDLWWYVQAGGLRGWVKGSLLILRGDLTDVPEVPVIGIRYTPTLYIGYTGNPLYPDTQLGQPLCALPGNLEYKVVGRNEPSTFFEIEAQCNGVTTTGWVQAEVGLLRNFGTVPIAVTG